MHVGERGKREGKEEEDKGKEERIIISMVSPLGACQILQPVPPELVVLHQLHSKMRHKPATLTTRLLQQ